MIWTAVLEIPYLFYSDSVQEKTNWIIYLINYVPKFHQPLKSLEGMQSKQLPFLRQKNRRLRKFERGDKNFSQITPATETETLPFISTIIIYLVKYFIVVILF